MKDDLKSSPIDVLWVVSSKNGTGNNGMTRHFENDNWKTPIWKMDN